MEPIDRLNAALEGRYRVERELGEGGMATVYLAEDLKHSRQVAIKVLRPELAAVVGAERFLAEIRTTANLTHPNILPLHDSGEADGFLYYVMPYVEGESLRERLDRERQLPVDEAVRIAAEAAEALDHAHRQGVVHRDIKPANILLRDGRPLVADFGIALAASRSGDGERLTETGLSLGTPHYMSPEQATGSQTVGPQTDIWALGCVLYEMLVGEPPYTGGTPQAILGKIITGEPEPVRAQRKTVPMNVDAAIARALGKVPADRFRRASDFVDALRDPGFGSAGRSLASPRDPTVRERAASVPLLFGALIVAVALALWGWLRPAPAPPVLRYELPLQEGREWVAAQLKSHFDIAPDGDWIVRSWPRGTDSVVHLERKRRHDLDFVPIPGTEGAVAPRISPDGSRIAFHDGRQLRVIPSDGGRPVTIATGSNLGYQWLTADALTYTVFPWQRIYRISALGGEPDLLYETRDSVGFFVTDAGETIKVGSLGLKSVVPEERAVLFQRCAEGCTERNTWVLDLESGEAHFLHEALEAQYLPATGHVLLGMADGTLLAAALDRSDLRLSSAPVPVLEGLATWGPTTGFTVSRNGTLMIGLGSARALERGSRERQAVWVTRSGEVIFVDENWRFTPGTSLGGLALSPEGRRLAVAIVGDDANDDVWVKELPDGPISRLTRDPARDGRPYFTPDGGEIVFVRIFDEETQASRLMRIRADGAGSATPFLSFVRNPYELDFSNSGDWLVLRVGGSQDESRDLIAYRLEPDTTEVPLLAGGYDEAHPKLSPDGRWLAYNSRASGRSEVYVRPFPEVQSARTQVSLQGGTSPIWNPVANELIYVECCSAGQRLISATYSTDSGFVITRRTTVLDGSELPELIWPGERATQYEIAPDGDRFLFLREAMDGSEIDTRIVVIENWAQELMTARLEANY